MGAFVVDAALDKVLNHILNNVDRVIFCKGEPSTYSDADTLVSSGGNKLAENSVGPSNFSGPQAGDTSGRKLTKDKDGVLADQSDSADHVAYVDDGGSTLLAVHEADDGNGSPLSFTKGLAYNLQATDVLEVRAAQTT